MGQMLSPAAKAIAAEVRAIRARKKFPQPKVYEAAGMSRSAYLRFENGRTGIYLDTLEAICAALGVTLPALIHSAEREHKDAFRRVKTVEQVAKDDPSESGDEPQAPGHHAAPRH